MKLDAAMKFEVRQRAQRIGTQPRWRWSVWIAAEPRVLKAIQRVEYVLHPSFPEPVKVVSDRKSGFRLNSSGWGEFDIKVRVFFGGKRPVTRIHHLTLGEPKPAHEKKLFFSYAYADQAVAKQLKASLSKQGYDIVDVGARATPGQDIPKAIDQAVAGSGTVIAILSGSSSKWADFELERAQFHGKPILPITFGEQPTGRTEQGTWRLQTRHLSKAGDNPHRQPEMKKLGDQVATALRDLKVK